MICKKVVIRLLAGAIGLPIVLAVLFLVMQLFRSLNDHEGAHFLHQCGTVILLIWGADLVALVIVTALRSIQQCDIQTKNESEKKDEKAESVDWSQEMRKWQNEMKSWENKEDTEK